MLVTQNQNVINAAIETLRRRIEHYSDLAWCVSRNNIIADLKQKKHELEELACEVENDLLMQEVLEILEAT